MFILKQAIVRKFKTLGFFLFFINVHAQQDIATNHENAMRNNANFIVKNADVKMVLTHKKEHLEATTQLTIIPKKYALSKMVLDAPNSKIRSLKVNDVATKYEQTDHQLWIFFNENQVPKRAIKIAIVYQIPLKHSDAFHHNKDLTKTQKTPFVLYSKADVAWYPTAFRPYQKYPQSITIKYPLGLMSISNGVLKSSVQKGDYQEDVWQTTVSRSSVKHFLVIGDLKKESETIRSHQEKIKVIQYFTGKSHQEWIMKKTASIIAFLSKKIGTKYPYPSLNILYLDDIADQITSISTLDAQALNMRNHDIITKEGLERQLFSSIAREWIEGYLTMGYDHEQYFTQGLAVLYLRDWIRAEQGKQKTALYEDEIMERYLSDAQAYAYVKYAGGLSMLRDYIGADNFKEIIQHLIHEKQRQPLFREELIIAIRNKTGLDCNWFFNQWFSDVFSYPQIVASYDFNTLSKTFTLTLKQIGKPFFLPVNIAIHDSGTVKKARLYIDKEEQSFIFNYRKFPDWIHVNSDHSSFGTFDTHLSDITEAIYRYKHAKDHRDQKIALELLLRKQQHRKVARLLLNTLDKAFYPLKIKILEKINLKGKFEHRKIIAKIEELASNAEHPLVRAAAIKTLGKLVNFNYKPIFENGFSHPSFQVKSNALEALYYIDSKNALKKADNLPDDVRKSIGFPLSKIYVANKTQEAFVAKYVVTGIYMIKDKDINKDYRAAMYRIARNGSLKAIEAMAEDMVAKGNKFKKYGFHITMIESLREILKIQENAPTHRKAQIAVLQDAIAVLGGAK